MNNKFLNLLLEAKNQFLIELQNIVDCAELEKIRQLYFNKNGILVQITEEFKKLSIEEKKKIGNLLVGLKKEINDLITEKQNLLFFTEIEFPITEEFDPTLSKSFQNHGSLHPYTESIAIISDFFFSMGFEILEGTILTDAYANFTSLNIPEDHPAREEHDTFWVNPGKYLLRTHTSNIQIKEAKKREYPFSILAPGIVYRNESTDASHDFMFAQLEGMYCGSGACLSSLLYILKNFLNFYFEKKNLAIRARPGVFPFVEPGLEIDFQCPFCTTGCTVCKKSQWIELGGAGMIHSFVKKEMGLKEDQRGWAFGMGLTRIVMLKYKINDVRKLHQSLLI